MKISGHHMRSPLLNINRACQTCHRWPEEELRARVVEIQDRTFGLRNQAMDVLIELGFHAGGEAARVLASSIDHLRRGQLAIRDARQPQ